ncbi:hypothetical protein MRX96_003369 [Rhipicephalus microplus]
MDWKTSESQSNLQSGTTIGSLSRGSESSVTRGTVTGSEYTTRSTSQWRTSATAPTSVEELESYATVRPMGKHKLFCVLGDYLRYYDYVEVNGLCDYAFFTFYGKYRAQFDGRPGPAVTLMLRISHKSTKTAFGIHVSQRQVLHWSVYHYGVLNLEVKPWEASTMDGRMKEVFEFLKVMRERQRQLKISFPGPPSPRRGFIVLGIRLWPANMVQFLAAISDAFEKFFMVDGLIPLTHINEDEFNGGYKECWISGAAPYRLAPNSNNSNVLGMCRCQCARACTEQGLLLQ